MGELCAKGGDCKLLAMLVKHCATELCQHHMVTPVIVCSGFSNMHAGASTPHAVASGVSAVNLNIDLSVAHITSWW